MPFLIELPESREADIGVEQSTRTLKYTAVGSEDDSVIEALVKASISAFFGGLQFQSYRISPKGNGVHDVEVRYASTPIKEIGQSSFTFDTTGGTQRLKKSISTISRDVGTHGKKIDFGGAINVGEDGKIEGVDVPISKFSFTVSRVIADPLPTAYANALEALTGCVNDDDVILNVSEVQYFFAAGELRFEGATGQKRGTDAWEITLKLEVSRNAINLNFKIPDENPVVPLNDEIDVAEKNGWDYLWIRYQERRVGSMLIPIPRQVNVERVSVRASLNVLFA